MAWTRIAMRLLRDFKDSDLRLNRVTDGDRVNREQLDKILNMVRKLYNQEVPQEVLDRVRVQAEGEAEEAPEEPAASGEAETSGEEATGLSGEEPSISGSSEGETSEAEPVEPASEPVAEPQSETTEASEEAPETTSTEETSLEEASAEEVPFPQHSDESTEEGAEESPSAAAVSQEASATEEEASEEEASEEEASEEEASVEQREEATIEETVAQETQERAATENREVLENHAEEDLSAQPGEGEHAMKQYSAEPLIRWSETELSPLAWSSALNQASEEIHKLDLSPSDFDDKEAVIPENVMFIISNSFEKNLKVEIPNSVLSEALIAEEVEEEAQGKSQYQGVFNISTIYEEQKQPVVERMEVQSEEEIEESVGEFVDFDMMAAKQWIERNVSPIGWVRLVSRLGREFKEHQIDLNQPATIDKLPAKLRDRMDEVVRELFDKDLLKGLDQEAAELGSSAASEEAAPAASEAPSSNLRLVSEEPGTETQGPSEEEEQSAAEEQPQEEEKPEEPDYSAYRYKALSIKQYCDDQISPIAWIRASSRIARVLRKEGLKINNPTEDTRLTKEHVELLAQNIKELFGVDIPDNVKYDES
jgi:hypothetical protein